MGVKAPITSICGAPGSPASSALAATKGDQHGHAPLSLILTSAWYNSGKLGDIMRPGIKGVFGCLCLIQQGQKRGRCGSNKVTRFRIFRKCSCVDNVYWQVGHRFDGAETAQALAAVGSADTSGDVEYGVFA